MPPAQNRISGLILLSTVERDGVEESLRAVLAPFTLEILDIQRIALRGRLIIGMLISFDPAHAQAIDEDINEFSRSSGIDVALDFSEVDSEK